MYTGYIHYIHFIDKYTPYNEGIQVVQNAYTLLRMHTHRESAHVLERIHIGKTVHTIYLERIQIRENVYLL